MWKERRIYKVYKENVYTKYISDFFELLFGSPTANLCPFSSGHPH